MNTEIDIPTFIHEQRISLELEMNRLTATFNQPDRRVVVEAAEAKEEGQKGADDGLHQTVACDIGGKENREIAKLLPKYNVQQSNNKNDPLVDPLPLSCDGGCLDKGKQAFIDTLVQSENPLTFRSNDRATLRPGLYGCTGGVGVLCDNHPRCGRAAMLRYGEFSPNHPAHAHRRLNAAPYLGLGEYDQEPKPKPPQQRHVHYNSNDINNANESSYKSNLNQRNERIKNTGKRVFIDSRVIEVGNNNKSVQTDIKNIRNNLIQQYCSVEPRDNNNTADYPRSIIATKPRNLNLNLRPNLTEDNTYEATVLEESDTDLDATSSAPSDRDRNCNNSCGARTDSVMHNNRSPILHRLDQRIGSSSSGQSRLHMDKPRSILSNRYYTSNTSPRDRLLTDLKHTYVPSVIDGFSYSDRAEEYERERVKKELYQNELRLQIEEKRRQATMRENQERVEQELENRRLEQQLLRMHEEELRDEERRTLRRNSDDLQRRAQELGNRASYQRRHTDSESCLLPPGHKAPSAHYSPPVARRNPGYHHAHNAHNMPTSSMYDTTPVGSRYSTQAMRNRMDSLSDSYGTYNTYGGGRTTMGGASVFNRYDSLSRIDALKQQDTALSRLEALTLNDPYSNRIQRRHSATHQDLSAARRSPKLQRRSSSSRFEDALAAPSLMRAAHSPVARELKNAIAVNSTRYSDALRRLEDKWQIPAVQKNIMTYDVFPDGHNRSILTQLGAIRMQLQQEQLRMDETMRRRGISSQFKAVDFH